MSSVPLGQAVNLRQAELLWCFSSRVGLMRGEEWAQEEKEGEQRGLQQRVPGGFGEPREGGRGVGMELLQEKQDLVGLREAERAKALAVGRGPGVVSGLRLCHHHAPFPSLSPRCWWWHLAVPRWSLSLGGDGGCTRHPPQNRPLSNSRLKLCLVNYSAARSRCFSVLIRRAPRWGKGKKHRKERERAAQGSKAAEVSKTEI